MRVRNNPNAKNEINMCDKYINNRENLQNILNKKQIPIYIEVGMGKGEFILQMALKNPNILFIGIELSETVLAIAIKKIKKYQEENKIILNNLYFMSINAKDIEEYFDIKQIDRIYLNFSDPWPKKRHAKRRLTSPKFLMLYKNVIKDNGIIKIKTDNRKFFEYTILSVNNSGEFKIEDIHLDLHKDDIENVMTEYEQKFCENGPIYMMVISKIISK